MTALAPVSAAIAAGAPPRASRMRILIPALAAAVVLMFVVSFQVGRYPIGVETTLAILASKFTSIQKTWPDAMETVVLEIRLPRIAAALLVGASLSSSGAACQSLFRNPLVSPSLLGVSAGAGFGAALAMLLSLPWLGVQALAFLFGLCAVTCSLAIGRAFGGVSLTVLVLAGIVVSALFEALLSAAKFVADPVNKLPAITFWLLGGLSKVAAQDVWLGAIPMVLGGSVLWLMRWKLNVLAMGEEEALALGVNAGRVRVAVILATTLMTASAVSVCGIVGWVGLLVPHIARALAGPRFEAQLPVSILVGGGFLLLIDDIVRSLPVELPLGILTALAGAPFFIYLIARARREWT